MTFQDACGRMRLMVASAAEYLSDGRLTVVVRPESAVIVGPREPVTIIPPPRPVWDDRGWTVRTHPSGRRYQGEYAVARTKSGPGQPRRFAGVIVEPPRGAITAYIADPPVELRWHPKGACFQLAQPPWFRLHWVRPAPSVDDAILYVERLLAEALHTVRKPS